MGQYFLPVNVTKEEYIEPREVGAFLKLWEWCANTVSGVFAYLLRKSNESGGGDVHHRVPEPKYAGRWAGDEVYLVGDYDESGLYEYAKCNYKDISQGLREEYNRFVESEDLKLRRL